MSRGVLYIVWKGETDPGNLLNRSLASLRLWHPELPYHVEEIEGGTLLDKARMFDLSPFDETLFLDADTVVMDRLDYGFKQADKHGLACCICECPWARRYPSLVGDTIEYNTGLLFFDKGWQNWHGDEVEWVFDEWKSLTGIDSYSSFLAADGIRQQPVNDQASFAAAIDQTGFNPFVLPLNWNFRHRWQKTVFGPVKIWHDYDDAPEWLERWNAQQNEPGAVIQCGRME